MMNGPLIKVAFAFAVVLMALSIAMFIFPEQFLIIGGIAGIFAIGVVGFILYMMVGNRKE